MNNPLTSVNPSDIISYLTIATVYICVMYLPYILVFKRSTVFLANRYYLIVLMLISLVIPLISFNVFPQYNLATFTERIILAEKPHMLPVVPWYKKPDIVFALIWGTVGVASLLNTMVGLFRLLFRIQTHKTYKSAGYTMVICKETTVSSFFRYIFSDKSDMDPAILRHEQVHIAQYHSLDLILLAVFKSIFWFHPFVYAVGRSLRESHEYYCDRVLTTGIIEPYEYASLLLRQFRPEFSISLSNQFSSLIKNRIKMLNKLKSNQSDDPKKYAIVMFLLFIGTFAMFSFKRYTVHVDTYGKQIKLDSLPQYYLIADTLKYEELVNGKLCKISKVISNKLPMDFYLSNLNKTEEYTDTLIDFNPETLTEKVTLVHGKINKIYQELINMEYKKSNPDYRLIEKWKLDGTPK